VSTAGVIADRHRPPGPGHRPACGPGAVRVCVVHEGPQQVTLPFIRAHLDRLTCRTTSRGGSACTCHALSVEFPFLRGRCYCP
jgi:hypothetical protein